MELISNIYKELMQFNNFKSNLNKNIDQIPKYLLLKKTHINGQ